MKKIARKVLLLLLFSFCCVFSGFLNVNVFAVSEDVLIGDGADGSVQFDLISNYNYGNNNAFITKEGYIAITGNTNVNYGHHAGAVNLISLSKIDFTNISSMSIEYELLNLQDQASMDGFGFGLLSSSNSSDFSSTFFAANACVPVYDVGVSGLGLPSPLSVDTSDVEGEYYISFGFTTSYYNQVSPAHIWQIKFTNLILYDESGDVVGIIDVLDAIKQQYAMEDGEDFGINDVISQHNNKMGVLSFGSDVMIQFLDLFQNTNPGTAQLTLPGFAITVQNVEYQVWQDQTFNFNQLESWFPSLIDIIRLILPAFVWLMVLRYCIGVFERNFLSK